MLATHAQGKIGYPFLWKDLGMGIQCAASADNARRKEERILHEMRSNREWVSWYN